MTIEKIAKRYLGIETLETQMSDDLDFHNLPVWQIEKALKEAYRLGKIEKLNGGEADNDR